MPQGSIEIDKPFFAQLNNTQTSSFNVNLQITISSGSNQLVRLAYQQIQLPQGLSTINTNELGKITEEITDEELRKTKSISKGEIQLCYTITNVFDNTTLGNHCVTLNLSKEPKVTEKTKMPLPLRFTGYAKISGNYADRKGSFQNLTANYTNVIVNPQLEVFDIPIGARINYSTASNENFQNMNFFSIYFDAEKFKQNMEQKKYRYRLYIITPLIVSVLAS